MVPIRVFIAEDHALFREGTRRLLEEDSDIEVVGEAPDGACAVAAVARLKPDVALMDIRMPELNGIEATRQIRAQSPHTAVLILSAYDDDDYVTSLLDAGASGYLLKTVRSAQLVDAVRRVHQGETVLHPDISRKLAQLWERQLRSSDEEASLTPKEMEVLQLVCRGLHNKGIAKRLGVSVRTVEGHMSAIFSRLGVGSRTEAAMFATSHGWIREDED